MNKLLGILLSHSIPTNSRTYTSMNMYTSSTTYLRKAFCGSSTAVASASAPSQLCCFRRHKARLFWAAQLVGSRRRLLWSEKMKKGPYAEWRQIVHIHVRKERKSKHICRNAERLKDVRKTSKKRYQYSERTNKMCVHTLHTPSVLIRCQNITCA